MFPPVKSMSMASGAFSRCGWRIVISLTAGHVTLLHSVAELARIELLVADFEGIRAT